MPAFGETAIYPCQYCLELFEQVDTTHTYKLDTNVDLYDKNHPICFICKNIFINLTPLIRSSKYNIPQNIHNIKLDNHNLVKLLAGIEILDRKRLNFDFLVLISKLYPTTNENTVYERFYFNIPQFSDIINNFTAFYSANYKQQISDSTHYHLGNYKYVKKRILQKLTNIAYLKLSQHTSNIIADQTNLFQFLNKLSLSNPLLFEQFSRVKLNFDYIMQNDQLLLHDLYPSRDIITITGWYNKLSSGMSQTTWKAEGFAFANSSVESSVEQSLGEFFNKLFRSDECKLIASGREDCDVRMMGRGRRFALEIYNARVDLVDAMNLLKRISTAVQNAGDHCIITNTNILDCSADLINTDFISQVTIDDILNAVELDNEPQCSLKLKSTHIEMKIADWRTLEGATKFNLNDFISKMIKEKDCVNYLSTLSFNNLRFTFKHKNVRRDLHISGESKMKLYSCLVVSTSDIDKSFLTRVELAVNSSKDGLMITQGNPLRITHRRSQKYRTRRIYKISTKLLHKRLFIINMVTEAGTYIKEFINGNLGRSEPSVSRLMGNIGLHVLKLDVLDIS